MTDTCSQLDEAAFVAPSRRDHMARTLTDGARGFADIAFLVADASSVEHP